MITVVTKNKMPPVISKTLLSNPPLPLLTFWAPFEMGHVTCELNNYFKC